MSLIFRIFSLSILFITLSQNIAMGEELKVLNVKEFQQKISTNSTQEDLSEYQINNEELLVLYKFSSNKKVKHALLALGK